MIKNGLIPVVTMLGNAGTHGFRRVGAYRDGLQRARIREIVGGIGNCRLMYSQPLSVKQNDFVVAGRSMGASDARLIIRHILPNSFPPAPGFDNNGFGRRYHLRGRIELPGVGRLASHTCLGQYGK
jgi:hypothetical protein